MNPAPTLVARPIRRAYRAGPAATVAALVFLNSAAFTPLFAQTAPVAPKKAAEEIIKLEAFVATGTRFNDRTVIQSPVPIDVITSADLGKGWFH